MKKSLLKSLALAALVLSFAACATDGSTSISTSTSTSTSTSSSGGGTTDPVVMSIGAATEWDTEISKTVQDGKLVTITDAVVNNKFGNSIIVQQTEGTTIDGIHAVEVITAEPVIFGWKDVVNVTGKVGDIDGRPVIKEAVVSYAVSEEASKGTGAVYGYGALSRAGFDAIGNRSKSGLSVWGGLVQFVTLPGIVVAGQASEFKVVFPGERLEETNPIAIPVTVPAMTEAQVEIVNAFFADKNLGAEGTTPEPVAVGDAFGIFAPLYWSAGNVGFLFTSYGAQLHDGFAVIDNVFADWGDIGLEEVIISPIPDLSKEGTDIYNYVLNTSYMEIEGNWLDNVLVMAYTDEADDDFEILVDRIQADTRLIWEIGDEEDGYILLGGFADDVVENPSTILELENMGNYINILISGEIEAAKTLNWEGVLEMYEASVADILGEESFVSALPEYADLKVKGFQFSDQFAESNGQWNIIISTDPTSTYDWGDDLIAAGFEYLGPDSYGDPQYLNATTGELISIDSSGLASGRIVIYIFFEGDGGDEEPLDWADVVEILEEAAIGYLEDETFVSALPEYADPLVEGFQVMDFLTGEEPGTGEFGILVFTEIGSTYDYAAALIGAGYTSLGPDEDGDIHYWNETSGEEVILVDTVADDGIMFIIVWVD